jgi:hypothetical protein
MARGKLDVTFEKRKGTPWIIDVRVAEDQKAEGAVQVHFDRDQVARVVRADHPLALPDAVRDQFVDLSRPMRKGRRLKFTGAACSFLGFEGLYSFLNRLAHDPKIARHPDFIYRPVLPSVSFDSG